MSHVTFNVALVTRLDKIKNWWELINGKSRCYNKDNRSWEADMVKAYATIARRKLTSLHYRSGSRRQEEKRKTMVAWSDKSQSPGALDKHSFSSFSAISLQHLSLKYLQTFNSDFLTSYLQVTAGLIK